MPTADKMIKTAASFIGTKGDHNIFNYWYWVTCTKTYTSDPGTAWCAAFQSYIAMVAGLKCKYSASAAGFATQFERIPVEKEHTVRKGDYVIFNWDGRTSTSWADHIGMVEWSTIGDNGLFGTIEGNTGNGAEGVVARVTRDNDSTYFTAFYRPKYDSASSTSTTKKVTTPKKVLYGIDVSSNQPADIFNLVKADFGIVKATGNPQGYAWNYRNPSAPTQAKQALSKTGCLGLYHFTWGKKAEDEAKVFVDYVKEMGYLGKAMLVVDYEAQALSLGRSWVGKLASEVERLAGYSPVIYASGNVITGQNLKSLGYPIWCANYYKGYSNISGYDTSGMKIWSGCEDAVLWQFTSSGYLNGYSKTLDLNVFYGTKTDWTKYCGSSSGKPASSSTSTATKKKSVTTIAKEVLAGKWGNGEARKKKLTAAGYSYKKVQAKVNELLAVEQAAKDVIAGKYGNGQDRISALKKAGFDPDAVQKRVNDLL